jgi:undecaprenyl-diphosphatase
MDLIEAIVLGAVQGITEFLPISSTGHLILVPWFLGWEPQGLAFDVALHVGTLFALLWYFRAEWFAFAHAGIRWVQGHRREPDAHLAMFIVGATIPGGLAGLLGQDIVEIYLRSPLVVSITLIALALVLVIAEWTSRREKGLENVSWPDALIVGCAQALAIIPGVSRSGATITAALFRGMKRDAAARFSFLLSAPIIAGAAASQIFDLVSEGMTASELGSLAIGILTSAVVGYLAIAFLLRYLATHTTYAFIYYRIILGLVVLVAFFLGFR